MKKSALDLKIEDVSIANSPAPIKDSPVCKLIPYPSTAADSNVESTELQSRRRKKRKKFVRFIKLEASALVVLVLALFAATSGSVAQAGLTLLFKITIGAAALAVVVIPVIFYGLTRQQYRYRTRRYPLD
jgi:hypothetical protein